MRKRARERKAAWRRLFSVFVTRFMSGRGATPETVNGRRKSDEDEEGDFPSTWNNEREREYADQLRASAFVYVRPMKKKFACVLYWSF